jgi:RimJ/RimL family protein N-acetyltransferase
MLEVHRNVSDIDIIAHLYYAMKACGRMDDVFYAGHDLLYFVNLMNEKSNWICTVDGTVVGFGLINEYGTNWKRAEVSFGMLPTCSARNACRLARMMLEDTFKSEFRLKYVYGTTPLRNRKAVKLAKVIGMNIVAITPNYLDYKGEVDDAVITYAERENIIGPRETEKANQPTV